MPTGDALKHKASTPRPWWDRQLALCLLGALVQFGWEKALGGYDEELAWWEDRRRSRRRPLLAERAKLRAAYERAAPGVGRRGRTGVPPLAQRWSGGWR